MLSTKYNLKTKKLEIGVGDSNYISVYRERPPTAKERRQDPSATSVSECVQIRFSNKKPKVVVNSDLTA